MVGKTPAAIARETLKLLSARQLAPTPENYHAVYLEAAGLEADAVLLPTALAEQVVHLLESARPAFEEGDVRLHEMADQLMGVTMHEPGCSRLVAVDVEEAMAMVDA